MKSREKFTYSNVRLRISDIKGMIDTYEFLQWQNKGEEKKECARIVRQLRKSIESKS